VRPGRGDRRAAVLRLNAAAVRVASSFRPDVVLSGHIVTSPAAWAIARRSRVPVVQYLYADELVHRPRLGRFSIARARATIAISTYTRDLAVGLGGDPGRIQLIPPGVDLPPAPRVGRAERPTVLTVGRLEDRFKGHDVMIRALPAIRERVPDLEWVVVGDGTLRRALEREAESEGVRDCIRFEGFVPPRERDDWFDRAHVFAMPARLPEGGAGGEGFGIVFVEAGAHGLPVVAGGVAGALDAVDERAGLLVDPTDPGAVADAVAGLLEDPDRAARLGAAGRERAAGFAWPLVAERVDALMATTARGA
jgi:phosphatidylinositol alpha-1,6-mannosyltransferase